MTLQKAGKAALSSLDLAVRPHLPLRFKGSHKDLLYSILGLYRENGRENGQYHIVYWEYIGIMEKKMECIFHWEYMGIMEKKMEASI